MSLPLPGDVRALVQKHLATGGYDSEEDVLREALIALDRSKAVLEDVVQGIADMEAGLGRPLKDIDTDLRSRHNISRQ